MKMSPHSTGLLLSLVLAILLVVESSIGIFTQNFYLRESRNWQVQSLAQDSIDLFVIVPLLVTTAILSYRKYDFARLLWAGIILYIFYTFIIYCFDVHFNRLFLMYCFTLGLSFYAMIWFVYMQSKKPIRMNLKKNAAMKTTGIFFIVISIAFYAIWLSRVLPAIAGNTLPAELIVTGLPTNPVHVMDLSVILPGIFITGIMLLKKQPLAFIPAIILLVFSAIMNITIGWIAVVMDMQGIEAGVSIAVAMGVLCILSGLLLAWNIAGRGFDRR